MSLYIIFSMNKSEYLNPTTGMWEIYFSFYECCLKVYFNYAELHFPFPRWLWDNGLLIRGWRVIIK